MPRRGRWIAQFETLERRMLLSGTSDPAALDDAPTVGLSDAPASVSVGSKSLLFIRIAFADNPAAEPQTLTSAQAMMGQVDQFMRANSFGRFSITPTFTSLVVLPQSEAWYRSAADGMNLLMADARQAALAANPAWDTATHDLYIVRYVGGPGSTSGQAQVGSPGVWLRTSSAGVAAHELAHNLGLWHANAHDAAGQTIIGPGINNEYGDPFDTMATSAGSGVDRNLDRPIDGDDYFALDRVHLGASADTSGADMNFDGRIDGGDYFLLDVAFLTQLPPMPAAGAQPAPTPPDDEPAEWHDLLK